MTKEQIMKMDRVDLILSVQGYIKDPAINACDLPNEKLREILIDIYCK